MLHKKQCSTVYYPTASKSKDSVKNLLQINQGHRIIETNMTYSGILGGKLLILAILAIYGYAKLNGLVENPALYAS